MKQQIYSYLLALALLVTANNITAFVFITTLYNEKSDMRLAEYIECIERNLAHPLIERIHVLYDTAKDDHESKMLRYLQSRPITLSYITGRPTYGMCFDLANTKYPHKKIILSNADIYFNHTLSSLSNYDLTNTFIGLTRWNVRKDGSLRMFKQYTNDGRFLPVTSAMSQDVWIFKTPLAHFENDAIELGTMTCDSLIAFQAYKAQLKVLNPCHSVQAIHLHMSNIRNYNPRIMGKGPIREITWTRLPAPYAQPVPLYDTIKKTPTYIPSAYEVEGYHTLSLKNTQEESLLKTIARVFNTPLFIKTNSSNPALIKEASKIFNSVFLIEQNQTHAAALKSQFSNLKIYSEDTPRFFKNIITENSGKQCIFFDNYAQPGKLINELEAWASTNKPNNSPTIIVIDDLHMLDNQTLNKVIALLKSVHSNYKLVVTGDNKLIAYTPRENREISRLMRACTISRLYDGNNFSFKDIIQAEGIIADAHGDELKVLQNLRDTFAHNTKPGHNGKAYYYLWNGLILLKQGTLPAAHQEFLLAYKHGLRDWRIRWYLDRSVPAH